MKHVKGFDKINESPEFGNILGRTRMADYNTWGDDEEKEKKSPKLRSVKVTYDDGSVIPTSMAHNLSDEEIKKYFAIGREFNIGDGENDKMAKVKKVEILK